MEINKFDLTFSQIVSFWVFMYFLIVIFNHFRQKKDEVFQKEEVKNSRELALIYLDQFYITNKYYTFFVTFIYINLMFFIFIFIRYLALGNISQILPKEDIKSILPIIYIYVIIFITIMLYRALIMIMFKKEINKFYIYFRKKLNNWSWILFRYLNLDAGKFFKFKQSYYYLNFKLSHYIFGFLYLNTYRIATLTYRENMYPIPPGSDYTYLLDDDLDAVIENKKMIQWAYKLRDLAKKYILIQNFLKILAYIFRFFYKHLHKLYQPLPYFILIIIFLIDVYNKEFNNIYIVSFLYILLKTKRDLILFLDNRKSSLDGPIGSYFYENSIPYEEQRKHFYINEKLTINKIYNSKENKNLYSNLKNIIEYAFKNFTNKYDQDYHYHQQIRREKGIYRRFLIILSFLSLGYNLYHKTNLEISFPIITLLFPIIIMIYAHKKTYYVIEYIENSFLEEYKYNRIYNIIFWIAAIIQGYIFWILILKSQVVFMDTEILWDHIIMIKKIYTIEEKVAYLYQYFEHYISLIPSNIKIDIENLRYIIREIDYTLLIDNKVKLKDIQVYIKLLVDSEYYMEQFYVHMKKILIENNEPYNPWYLLLRDTLFISGVVSVLLYFNSFWLIFKQVSTPYGLYLIAKELMKSYQNMTIKIFEQIIEIFK